METRKEQKAQRKTKILEAGLDLFVSRGYAATKITDIAEKAGMSTGLLFHYFESKEKLYEELVKMGINGTAYSKNQKYDHAIDYFDNITKALFAYMTGQPAVAKMFALMSAAQRNDATPAYIREIAKGGMDVIEKFVPIVEWGQREGTIKEGDPLVISNAFWCSIQGIAEQFAADPSVGLPEAGWIVDIVRKK